MLFESGKMMLTSKQRAILRKEAHGMQPVFQIGKDGVEENMIKAADEALAARELIKLRALETSPLDIREAADELAGGTGADVVQVIGHTVVLYRQKKKDSQYADMLKERRKK